LLMRSIEIAPDFADGYRLLAMVDLMRDEQLGTAVALLQKALSLKKDDAELELLLARILLRNEDAAKAKEVAERVAAKTSDDERRAEAAEIIKESVEYIRAISAAAEPTRMNITLGDRRTLVVLKRSWLADADVTQIDRERANNNYNLIILRPTAGELQVVGRIVKITCAGPSVFYRVSTSNGRFDLTSADFSGVRMTVAKEGENTFQIGCDIGPEKQLAVINYRPSPFPVTSPTNGTLTAISFVADDFRLKSLAEMAAARVVAIDDDTLKRLGPPAPVTAETIRRSILQALRRPQRDEQRIVGRIENIACSPGSILFSVSSDGKTYKLMQVSPGNVDVHWFTVASTQLSVTCGSGPIVANTLITFLPSASGANSGELRSIEFIPVDLKP
jgi:hypothetical protein